MNTEENKKKSLAERFLIGGGGFCAAGFLTPLIVWLAEIAFKMAIPPMAQFGIAFVVGQFGLKTITLAIPVVIAFFKKK